MNSDEEKALFEKYGWEYDHVQRKWFSPLGWALALDYLVTQAPDGERYLRAIVRRYGRREEAS